MKSIVIVVGNMGSGKSTFASLLAEKLAGFEYVCLDDIRKSEKAQYLENKNKEFELKIEQLTSEALERHEKIIYESTGATRFFQANYNKFLKSRYKLFIVKIQCRKAVCLARHRTRKDSGKAHIIPHFRSVKTDEEMIDWFDQKSKWIRPDLTLDSEQHRPEEMVQVFLNHYFGSTGNDELRSLIDKFDYDHALAWFKKHVEGKFFIKELLSKGADPYNTLKLKKELNLLLNSVPVAVPYHQKEIVHPKPLSQKEKESNDELIEEIRENLESKIDDLEYELSDLREKLSEKETKSIPKYSENASSSKEEWLIDEKWKPLYKEANYIFSQLDFETDEEKRKEMTFKILDLMDQVQEMWYQKDFLEKHGELPNFQWQGIDQLTIDQMATRIRTLRTYISKANKGKLNSDRIPEWKAEMEELERRVRQ